MNVICKSFSTYNPLVSIVKKSNLTLFFKSNRHDSSTSGKPLKDCDRHVVILSRDTLSASYAKMHRILKEHVKYTLGVSAFYGVSGAWLELVSSLVGRGEFLFEPKITLGFLSVLFAHRVFDFNRIKKGGFAGAVINHSVLTDCQESSQKIGRIFLGPDPKIKLTFSGVEVSGPLGDPKKTTLIAKEKVLLEVRSARQIVVPKYVIKEELVSLISSVMDGWAMNRGGCLVFGAGTLLMPMVLNVHNVAFEALIPSSEIFLSVMTPVAGAYAIYDSSLDKTRDDLSNYLKQAKNPRELLALIVDQEDLKGSFSYVNEWIKDANLLSIRIGRTGELIFYKNDKNSPVSGPFSMSH